ncbi:MAG: hypothetical protein ACRDJM_00075, partial [Actinomycetota bacterium]
ASGPGRLVALRTGPWVARIKREGALVWSVGGAFGASIHLPSIAGDQVQLVILSPSHCDIPVTGGQMPVCNGAGPLLAYEGGPEIPFLP